MPKYKVIERCKFGGLQREIGEDVELPKKEADHLVRSNLIAPAGPSGGSGRGKSTGADKGDDKDGGGGELALGNEGGGAAA